MATTDGQQHEVKPGNMSSEEDEMIMHASLNQAHDNMSSDKLNSECCGH